VCSEISEPRRLCCFDLQTADHSSFGRCPLTSTSFFGVIILEEHLSLGQCRASVWPSFWIGCEKWALEFKLWSLVVLEIVCLSSCWMFGLHNYTLSRVSLWCRSECVRTDFGTLAVEFGPLEFVHARAGFSTSTTNLDVWRGIAKQIAFRWCHVIVERIR
jgi:hypothetical protein